MFPLPLKLKHTEDSTFEIGEVRPEPLRMPELRIFELDNPRGIAAQDIGQGSEEPLFWPDSEKVLETLLPGPTLHVTRLIESTQMFEAMGVPKEFLEEQPDHTASETMMRILESRSFAAQYQQLPAEVVHCRCGHAEDVHRVRPQKHWRQHGVGHCLAEGPRECECNGFVAAGEGAEHVHLCRRCGLPFDMRELDQVLAHEHSGPREAINTIGRQK